MGKAFTVHSVHHVRSVYCGWHLLWEKCSLCTVFYVLEVFTVGGVRSIYCGCVRSGKSVYCAQCSSC